jgi:hypothetical protein
MALQKNYNWNGVEIENCYIRIDKISGKTNLKLEISYNTPAKVKLFTGEANFTAQIESELHPTVKNFIHQGYDYLKTLPELENATDI